MKRNNSKWRREKKNKKPCRCVYEEEIILRRGKTKYHEYEYEITVRRIKSPCDRHEANYAKKSDKLIHRLHKKTGRGYTKSPKPLEERK